MNINLEFLFKIVKPANKLIDLKQVAQLFNISESKARSLYLPVKMEKGQKQYYRIDQVLKIHGGEIGGTLYEEGE